MIKICTPLLAAAALVLSGCATTPPPIPQERIAEIIASPDRRPADRSTDVRRKPAEILAFIGIRQGWTALDLSAGGGYTTELIARAVGPTGRVYGQSRPLPANAPKPPAPEGGSAPSSTPRPPPTPSPVALAERAKNPSVSHIVAVVRPFEDPVPPEIAPGTLDLATLMFNYHDLAWNGTDRAKMNRAVFAALKSGGVYVLADHSGRPGTGASEAGTLHRIEEAFLQREVEAAGFRFAAQGNFLRNPNDPRDKNNPEPPMPKDEFVLKFVKP